MAYKHSTNAMKNLSIMMLLGAFFTLCVTSCSKDDDDSINSSTEQQQQEPTYLKTSDLNGVWSVSGSNGIYFIDILYSFYRNRTLFIMFQRQVDGGWYILT